MICTSLQNRTFEQILEVLEDPAVEMAEIRLDRCPLTDEQIEELFSESDTPLIATCRIAESPSEQEAERRLRLAIEAGARFADLEIEAPAPVSKRFQHLCRKQGTEIIRSYHNFEETPEIEILQRVLARCFRYGADIAKIVTTCHDAEDAARIESLYTIVLEEVDSLQGRLVAFGMGDAGRGTRLECLRRGSPFTYAAPSLEEATAPGQWSTAEMNAAVYGDRAPYRTEGRSMPASKSFAQRAILAAALAQGTSHLSGYSPCGDSEAALRVAEALGATVRKDGDTLAITGIGAHCGQLPLERLDTGESGLLTRLSIPVLAAVGSGRFTVEGHGTLLRRPLEGAADIMASYGVLLSNAAERDGREVFVPASVKGHLIPGTADVPGRGGSQLISGLLMALPLCDKDSVLHVSNPRSIPYMYITLDVLRHFGVQTRSEMEGDTDLLDSEDWSACTGITFRVRGRQRYRSADFAIEGDWSAAANFLVAGAVFGSAELTGMDTKSLQADLTIIDILVEAGAVVSQLEEGTVCVRKAPLEAFHQDLNHAPDLFPIVAVLAAFCAGESRIGGIGRLTGKESNRAEAVLQMLVQMGVEARIEGDDLVVFGESLSARLLNGRLLAGGEYTSRHDHRMVMALKVASLGTKSPIVIDDEACVGKSFPGFWL